MPRFISDLETALGRMQSSMSPSSSIVSMSPRTMVTSGLARGTVAPGRSNNIPAFSTRLAQSNTIFTQPSFYSPLHTPQNWQIPSKRREQYQWIRYFVENEPKVAAAVDFYCFEPNMQVLMADGGHKSIASVDIGDMVRSHDGSVNMVVRKFERETSEEMLRIKISGVAIGTLRCTYGHELLVKRGDSVDFIKAEELREGDFLLTPSCYDDSEGSECSDKDKDLFWLLGMYSAEGCPIPLAYTDRRGKKKTTHQGVYFTLSFEEKDTVAQTIVSKIENVYGKGRIKIYSNKARGICRVAVRRKEVADDLCGMCPGMSRHEGSKRFAPWVMKSCNEKLRHCLGGFMCGDGCFNKSNGFQGVGVSKRLVEQITNICDKLGLENSFTKIRTSPNRQTAYNVRISRRAADAIYGLTGKIIDNKVDESYAKNIPYFNDGNYICRKVTKITPYQYSGKVYDLEVENKHSYVVNRVSVHNSKFSQNGFVLQCDDPKISKFYEHLVKKLKLESWCKQISREYYTIGDVFPFLELECPECRGSMVTRKGEPCTHPHGSFRRLVVLNPDWIDVQTNVLAEEPVITLLPDDELKRIVWHKQPKAIYDRIPPHIREMILSGRPIPLDTMSVSHIRFNPYPYGTYGNSMVRRLFKVLAYKDKLMTAQWTVAERLILPVRIVKIGNDERPAGAEDIAAVQQQLAHVANDPNMTLVTHHAFDYDWVGTNGRILQLSNEYELVNKEILQGLMLNEALLSGDMAGYSSAAIGAEAIIQRMEEWRRELATWIEDSVFKPVAQMKGFVDEEATSEIGELTGEAVYLYPTIKWNEMHLRDKTQSDQILLQLHEKGLVSSQTVLEKLEFDYDQEVERLRYETAAQSFGAMGQDPAGGGMGGGMGAPMGGGMPGGDPAGGMGGGMDAGVPGDLAGGMDVGAAPGGAAPAAAGSQGKIMTRKNTSKKPEEEVVQPSQIKLTSLEQKMFKTLLGMRLPFQVSMQYPLAQYRADFAIPNLKLAIEVDGAKWHNDPVSMARDKKRDAEIALYGWTVLRFGEKEVKDKIDDVRYTISTVVNDLWKRALKDQKEKNEARAQTMSDVILKRGDAKAMTMSESSMTRLKFYQQVLEKEIKEIEASNIGEVVGTVCSRSLSDDVLAALKPTQEETDGDSD